MKRSLHSLDDDVILHQHVVLSQPLNLALPDKPHQGEDPVTQFDALKTNQASSGDTAVSEHGTPHNKMHTH